MNSTRQKFFLLLAAFTCAPTYADIDPKYIAAGSLILILGASYALNQYCNTPADNQLPPTPTPLPTNTQSIPHKNGLEEKKNEEISNFSVEVKLPENFEKKIEKEVETKIEQKIAGYFKQEILDLMYHANK